MNRKRKILAISGSTRLSSTNLGLIEVIRNLYLDQLHINIFDGLTDIPHFNPDLDTDNPPPGVARFRNLLKETEGVLICTPEYAMGVPGTLKNAIDWTVSSMEFSHKPVALITASSQGQKAHFSLLETLKIIECNIPETCQLLISFVKTKVSGNKIIDPVTLEQVKQTIDSLIRIL